MKREKKTTQMMNNSLKTYVFAEAIHLIKIVDEHGRFGKVREFFSSKATFQI